MICCNISSESPFFKRLIMNLFAITDQPIVRTSLKTLVILIVLHCLVRVLAIPFITDVNAQTLDFTVIENASVLENSWEASSIIESGNESSELAEAHLKKEVGKGSLDDQLDPGNDDEDTDDIGSFPNPMSETAIIDLSQTDMANLQISIVDLSGKITKQFKAMGGTQRTITRDFMKSGQYFIIAENENGVVGTGTILVQ